MSTSYFVVQIWVGEETHLEKPKPIAKWISNIIQPHMFQSEYPTYLNISKK